MSNKEFTKKDSFTVSKTIISLFQESVLMNTTSIAYEEIDIHNEKIDSISYLELEYRSNFFAHKMKEMGVNAGDTVGVYIDRSISTVTALLAILKIQAIYVPIDTQFPEHYVKHIIEDAQLKLIITNNIYLTILNTINSRTLFYNTDDTWHTLKQYAYANSDINADSLIVYTSGSTGFPKGVVHSQKQLINRFTWMWNDFPFLNSDVMCQRSPVTFMPSLWEFFGGLLQGIKTIIVPNLIIKDPQCFCETIKKYNLTWVTVVPSMLRLMLNEQFKPTISMSSIRVMITLGEPFNRDLYDKLRCFLPEVTVINDYGCTETNSILFQTFNHKQQWDDSLWYKPIPNTNVKIINEEFELVPPNVPGEVCVQGISLAKAYLNNEKLTNEKFIVSQSGERIYLTGDIAYFLDNGGIVLLGRKDSLVKIRGNRVDLGGVQSWINKFPSIIENVTLVKNRSGKDEDKILVTFFVVDGSYSDIENSVKVFLRQHLPEYMIPSEFYMLNQLPKLENGKVDQKKLLAITANTDKSSLLASDNQLLVDVRHTVIHMASRLLNCNINNQDFDREFIFLGFDSILLVSFLDEINKAWEIKLKISDLYSYPNINALTIKIKERLSIEELLARENV